jgi:hypothetical protein
MFKKLGKKMGGKGPPAMRYRFEVQVVHLEGVPDSVECARVVMARSAKVSMTEVAESRSGTITFTKVGWRGCMCSIKTSMPTTPPLC